MRQMSVIVTDKQYEKLKKLVDDGEYQTLSEAIRAAINLLLKNKSQ